MRNSLSCGHSGVEVPSITTIGRNASCRVKPIVRSAGREVRYR